jgi:tricorn protease
LGVSAVAIRTDWEKRGGRPYGSMQYAFRGHIVVLINEETASDGEAFAEGARRLGIATIMGTRTWGGEIWLSVSDIMISSPPSPLLSSPVPYEVASYPLVVVLSTEADHTGIALLQADMFALQAGGIASGGQSGVYSTDGKEWLIEGPGLVADDGFEVDNLPVSTYQGSDAQIVAAVAELQKQIEEEPVVTPTPPPYPNKAANASKL